MRGARFECMHARCRENSNDFRIWCAERKGDGLWWKGSPGSCSCSQGLELLWRVGITPDLSPWKAFTRAPGEGP